MKTFFRTIQRACRWGLSLSAFLVALDVAPSAWAALGDDVSAIATDQARMKASLQVFQRKSFAIHEMGLPTGTTLRQYVSDAGKVFAVSWSGGFRPNLRDVMGVHYDRYIAGTRGRRVARGPVRIELPGMVVVMGGRGRNFFGHVYLTDLLPTDFDTGEMRPVAP